MILCKYWSLPVRQDLGTFSVSNMGVKMEKQKKKNK
jgi:hypothetical protein